MYATGLLLTISRNELLRYHCPFPLTTFSNMKLKLMIDRISWFFSCIDHILVRYSSYEKVIGYEIFKFPWLSFSVYLIIIKKKFLPYGYKRKNTTKWANLCHITVCLLHWMFHRTLFYRICATLLCLLIDNVE